MQDERSSRLNDEKISEKRDAASGGEKSGVAGTIYTVAGGPTYGDTKSARKAYAKAAGASAGVRRKRGSEHPVTITFSDDDYFLSEPTDDALVIDAVVANFQVKRVLIDSGSSVNVMFDNVFDGCNLERGLIEGVQTPVVGIGNVPVPPIGRVKLPVTLKDGDKARTETLEFVVMKGPSAYNMFLGRPGINKFEAIPSNLHLVVKFPTPQGVAALRGDVKVARQCYVASIKIAEKAQVLALDDLEPRESVKKCAVEPGVEVEEIQLDQGAPECQDRLWFGKLA